MRELLRVRRRAPWAFWALLLGVLAAGCPADEDEAGDDGPDDDDGDPGWTPMASGTTAWLYGVWGSSAADVYAVGKQGTVLHYDGASWTALDSGTTKWLLAVGGSAADDVVAVGEGGTILRIDGGTVTATSGPTDRALYGVWAASPDAVFAVGEGGTIARYDGTAWTATTVNAPGVLAAVWGTSATNVYAAGRQVVYHYDGTAWTRERVYLMAEDVLWGVAGDAPKDVAVVGEDEASGIGLFFRYDGVAWNFVSATPRWLYDVWTSPATGAFAVGGAGTIVRQTGGVLAEMDSGTREELSAVWGAGSEVFVVGTAGTILHYAVPTP
jgi:hypothetical protein